MRAFLKNEDGATAIEYAMIGAAMAAALLIAMPFIANSITSKFNNVAVKINSSFN